MKPESFEKKLIVARDVESEPNYEELKIIRSLERFLQKNKSFVGIAPFGSTVGGYSIEHSDIDVFILYDSDKGEPPSISNVFEWQMEMEQKGQRPNVMVTENSTGLEFSGRFQNVNPDRLVEGTKSWLKEYGTPNGYYAESLEAMTRAVTGKKINQYRKEIAARLGELNPEQKRIIRDLIIKDLLKRDRLGLSKRTSRMPELSNSEHERILSEREKMWRARVQKIWNLSDA